MKSWPADRCKPSVFIIGARKGGTTSLYHYLSAHPSFKPARSKEIHFLSSRFSKGTNWYARHFPVSEDCQASGFVTGEASVSYLSSCEAPQRLSAFCDALGIKPKIVVLLRNPVSVFPLAQPRPPSSRKLSWS